jgi:hypothetical protein
MQVVHVHASMFFVTQIWSCWMLLLTRRWPQATLWIHCRAEEGMEQVGATASCCQLWHPTLAHACNFCFEPMHLPDPAAAAHTAFESNLRVLHGKAPSGPRGAFACQARKLGCWRCPQRQGHSNAARQPPAQLALYRHLLCTWLRCPRLTPTYAVACLLRRPQPDPATAADQNVHGRLLVAAANSRLAGGRCCSWLLLLHPISCMRGRL